MSNDANDQKKTGQTSVKTTVQVDQKSTSKKDDLANLLAGSASSTNGKAEKVAAANTVKVADNGKTKTDVVVKDKSETKVTEQQTIKAVNIAKDIVKTMRGEPEVAKPEKPSDKPETTSQSHFFDPTVREVVTNGNRRILKDVYQEYLETQTDVFLEENSSATISGEEIKHKFTEWLLANEKDPNNQNYRKARLKDDDVPDVPVETLGSGIFNALGDAIDGLVNLTDKAARGPDLERDDDSDQSEVVSSGNEVLQIARRVPQGTKEVVSGVFNVVKGGGNIAIGTAGSVVFGVATVVKAALSRLLLKNKKNSPSE